MGKHVNYKFGTVCLVQNGDYVLLLNRQHDKLKATYQQVGKWS